MGIGGDTSMVPKWMMMNGKVASTYKEFINSYSTNKACLIEVSCRHHCSNVSTSLVQQLSLTIMQMHCIIQKSKELIIHHNC